MDSPKANLFRRDVYEGNLFHKAIQCLACNRPSIVGNILRNENKILQIEEINDIEQLMPDMVVEVLESKIDRK